MILLFFEICKKDFVVMVFIMLRDFILENFLVLCKGEEEVGGLVLILFFLVVDIFF